MSSVHCATVCISLCQPSGDVSMARPPSNLDRCAMCRSPLQTSLRSMVASLEMRQPQRWLRWQPRSAMCVTSGPELLRLCVWGVMTCGFLGQLVLQCVVL